MRRDGLRSSPGNLCIAAEILGLLCSPSRHKAAPTQDRVSRLLGRRFFQLDAQLAHCLQVALAHGIDKPRVWHIGDRHQP
ncbi:hypothetical protein KAM380_054130 [Aeromonas caviae]|nr:hypothetical protein KAM380_054130 [Aeromonas caviae]